jgi:hypothetical protein
VSQDDKKFLLIAAALTVVISLLIILVGGSWWVGPVICVPLSGLVFVGKRNLPNSDAQPTPPPVYNQPPLPPPPQPGSIYVQNIVLPTADRDYRLALHGLVCWRQLVPMMGHPQPSPEQLAISAITERASQLTGGESAGDYELVSNRLSTELAMALSDRTGLVEAWAQHVTLVLPDADLQRLRKLADVRKDEQVWEHQRNHERNKRAYLHDDVLRSTGSALVWWLAQDITKVSEAVALIGTLAQLSAAARDTTVDPLFLPFITPPPGIHVLDSAQMQGFFNRGGDGSDFPTRMTGSDLYQDPGDAVVAMRRLMDIALPSSSEPDRARLADLLATQLSKMDAHDVAARIREAFNAPDFDSALDTEHPEPTEDTAEYPNTRQDPPLPSPFSSETS